MKVKIVLTMVAVFVLAGALIVWGGAGASVAQAQEPEPTPAPTEAPPPPPEEPPFAVAQTSPSGGGSLSPSLDKADAGRPAPAAVPASWQMNFKFVVGTAFHPRRSAMTYSMGGTSNGCIYATADAYEFLVADFQLPDGAIVDLMRLFYYDANASYDSYLFLTDYDGAGGNTDIISAASDGSSGYGSAVVYPDYTVDTLNHPLLLLWSPWGGATSASMLCGARIRYWTPPVFGSFMPLIQR